MKTKFIDRRTHNVVFEHSGTSYDNYFSFTFDLKFIIYPNHVSLSVSRH